MSKVKQIVASGILMIAVLLIAQTESAIAQSKTPKLDIVTITHTFPGGVDVNCSKCNGRGYSQVRGTRASRAFIQRPEGDYAVPRTSCGGKKGRSFGTGKTKIFTYKYSFPVQRGTRITTTDPNIGITSRPLN